MNDDKPSEDKPSLNKQAIADAYSKHFWGEKRYKLFDEQMDFEDQENNVPENEPINTPLNPDKTEKDFWKRLGITKSEFKELMAFRANQEARNKYAVLMLGVLFTPYTLIGALIGYVRGYNRFFRDKDIAPNFYPLYPIVKVAMAVGIILIWALLCILLPIELYISSKGYSINFVFVYLIGNFVLSLVVLCVFKIWQRGVKSALLASDKFGSARFAREDELYTFYNGDGFYIGDGHTFNDKGHILTVAGTRGGKGTNIIVPNLLGAGGIKTSWVVIDPKGENAVITARYQKSIGQDVVVLNPWSLFTTELGEPTNYNPLDMLTLDSPHLVDDVQVIAEMIVPIDGDGNDKFWADSARTVVTGLLLHLVTSQSEDKRTLTTLWEWARLVGDDWDKLIQDMGVSDDPINGRIIKNSAHEILKLAASGDETFGGIISNVLQATDFLKSPALQQSLKSGFDPKTLVEGKTTVYVIIPADKLRSHARWLRLVVTSMMRAIIRQPKDRVCFLLDEFAALGYLPEIETALSTYAGYNVTVWPILQSLIQLSALYKTNWQTFIANCTVRQYFTINDNFSADYISKAIGETSRVVVSKAWFGIKDAESSNRLLVTPDELRRESGKRIFMFIDDLPPTYVDKLPYYKVPELNKRADKNPYI